MGLKAGTPAFSIGSMSAPMCSDRFKVPAPISCKIFATGSKIFYLRFRLQVEPDRMTRTTIGFVNGKMIGKLARVILRVLLRSAAAVLFSSSTQSRGWFVSV